MEPLARVLGPIYIRDSPGGRLGEARSVDITKTPAT